MMKHKWILPALLAAYITHAPPAGANSVANQQVTICQETIHPQAGWAQKIRHTTLKKVIKPHHRNNRPVWATIGLVLGTAAVEFLLFVTLVAAAFAGSEALAWLAVILGPLLLLAGIFWLVRRIFDRKSVGQQILITLAVFLGPLFVGAVVLAVM